MQRREFLSWSIKAGAALMLPTIWSGCQGKGKTSGIALPALPYAENALEPVISAQTIGFHYGKHHRGYVDKLNKLVKGTPFAGMELTEIIEKSSDATDQAAIFNNAAQAFNHTFYWNGMSPEGGGTPPETVMEKIDTAFGGLDGFKTAFLEAATGQFGSGWAWLVVVENELGVMATANADTPIAHGIKPLLVVDVWEHAYYLDYQNRRKDYVQAFLDKLVNWPFVEKQLSVDSLTDGNAVTKSDGLI